ncbi:glycosyltransferase family 4 protein [Mesohalobacter halotolerans]|uniref:Glycosyltransferase family 4 protein n=1 Tax=Mesohalobacter halotolerans TaxID=1883405 RepID=A0A4U5TT07_9FLAO|nr:glycosyltransferase family 4 protein [Mesohalobacter halotolerans]TKS56981.1 glycosyltransferase family 4 protein [Mesohalobacter halotolerans]
MHILVISQHYYPEMGAPAARYYDFSKYWIEKGHKVTVVTAFPNFPDGKIDKKYKWKFLQKEKINNVNIIRTYIWASPKLRFIDKTLGYITFTISSSLYLIFNRIRYDLVIATCPPPNVGIPALIVKKIKKIPLIVDMRDLWPEGLINSGRLKNKYIINFLTWLEKKIYSNSSLITVVTNGKKENLIKREIDKPIEVISNGVDIDAIDTAQLEDVELIKLFSKYEINFLYAGVFNPSQGLSVIVKATKILNEKYQNQKKFGVILIGDGSERIKIEQLKTELNTSNVHILGIKPKETVFSSLKKARAILITLKRRKDRHTIPSKIYESMASNRPLLFSAGGEAEEIVKNIQAGLISPPEDVNRLVINMDKYISDKKLADEHGKNGYVFCKNNFDRKNLAIHFLNKIINLKNYD